MAMLMMFLMIASPIVLLVDCAIDGIHDLAALGRFSLRQFFVFLTCLACFLSLLYEPWTFYLRFAMSRQELERLAHSVETGEEIEPQWAGLFFIEKARREKHDHQIYTVLWTELGSGPEGFVHPACPLINDYSVALHRDPEWSYFSQD